MAKYYNESNTQKESTWQEITRGVKIRKSANGTYFSIDWYGAIIHGCSVKSGKNGPFISWPAFKNSDGKYVKRAYIWADSGTDDETTLKRVLEAASNL